MQASIHRQAQFNATHNHRTHDIIAVVLADSFLHCDREESASFPVRALIMSLARVCARQLLLSLPLHSTAAAAASSAALLAPTAVRAVHHSYTLSHSCSSQLTRSLHTRSTPIQQEAAAASATPQTTPEEPLTYTLASDHPAATHDEPEKEMFAKPTPKTWHLFDASDQVVGRLAGRIATLLMGKHKPTWTRWKDEGDYVVVLNASKLRFTGKKWDQKLYRKHSGYAGGLKEIPASRWRHTHPDRILRHAVAGMIRKTKLKLPRLDRLKIYPGVIHPHVAQFGGRQFDVTEIVPQLKAQKVEELKQHSINDAKLSYARDVAVQGAKAKKPAILEQAALQQKKKKKVSKILVEDESIMPQNEEIKKAIVKDREARKGKPIVML